MKLRESLRRAWVAFRFGCVWCVGVVTHNLGLKLLSLFAAFSLWFFVNAGERDAEAAFRVSLELHNIPADFMLVSPPVDFVNLRVSGPRTLLGRIDSSRLAIALDVSGVRPGPSTFRVVPDSLELPRGVTIVQLTPSEVTLAWARKDTKEVPVRVAFSGKPAGDLRVTDIKVAPQSVLVFGPKDEVEQVKLVETVPLDLSASSAGVIERDLSLSSPREYMSYSAERVHAQVRLEEPEVTRTMRRVPIVVRNSDYEEKLTPGRVRVTVRGPKSVVHALELDHGGVYIDASGRAPGNYHEAPEVDLPADVELLKLSPSKVRLQLEERKTDAQP